MKRAALLILDIINRTHVTKNHLLNLKIVMKLEAATSFLPYCDEDCETDYKNLVLDLVLSNAY